MPVITIACGTGSALQSGRRAFPRDDAEHEENAAAHQVEGEDLAQRLGIGDEAIEAETDQRRADKPSQRRRGHRRGSRRGGPATSMARVTAMERTMNASMNRISGLGEPGRIGEKSARENRSRNAGGQKHERTRDKREPQPKGVRLRRLGQSRHHDDHPHRGENGAALKRAAGLIRADPEDVDADQDAERRQQLREEGQRRLRPLRARLSRSAAPVSVGGERPYADHGQNQHHLLEHGVECAIGDQDGGDRIAEAGFGQMLHRLRRQRRALVGQQQHDAGERQQRRGCKGGGQTGASRPLKRCLVARRSPLPQPRGGADEQNAGHAAADRRLRQRHIDREQAYPDERQQQPIDDIADRRRERSGRENGPGRRPRKPGRRGRCRAPAERSCGRSLAPHRAPDELRGGRAGQLHERPNGDELERGEQAFGARQEAEHDEAETEIVSLGQRVQAAKRIGKAQQANRTGKEEEDAGADRGDAEEVDNETHRPSAASGVLRGRGAVDEGGGSEGGEQRKPKGDILDPARARRRGNQKQRTRCPRCR